MAAIANASHQLAILGGKPAFSAGNPVPLIHPQGYGPKGDFSVIDAIFRNETNEESVGRASRQRFVAKVLPGIEGSGLGFRAQLQARIGDFLEIDFDKTSVICVTSGTNALRSVLKAVRPPWATTASINDSEVIVPQTTVGATVEAVIGKLIVRKSALGHGIDGNGAPWLRRQSLFPDNSIAVKKTGMFVVPSSVKDLGNHVALELPYIASHSIIWRVGVCQRGGPTAGGCFSGRVGSNGHLCLDRGPGAG
ncbi:DegT/DnrJ/EryC1/StrS aminotransferase, partial [Metarhizium majus ARSEF 297]